jgi:hypothetical protein
LKISGEISRARMDTTVVWTAGHARRARLSSVTAVGGRLFL